MAYVLTFPANSFTHFVYDKSTNALKYLAGYNNIPEDQFWEDAIPCGYFGASQFCQPLDCNDELTLVFQWDRTGAEYPVINIRDLDDNLIGILDHPTEIPSLSGWFTLTFSVNDLCDGTDCFDPYSGCFRFSVESVVNVLTDGDNGTFESGTLDGFTTGQDNGVAISTVEARTGTYSALVTAATSGTGNRVWLQSSQIIAFQPCDTYTFTAWIWQPTGNEVLTGACYSGGCSPAININVTDAAIGVDYTLDAITGWTYGDVTEEWFEISITITAINAFNSRVSIRSGPDDFRRVNGIMYVDDITVIPENTGIIEARSEKFCFANALTSCTSKAIYSNDVPAYGQPDAFSTEIRLPAQLAQDYRKSKHEPFRYSDGVVENVYSDIQTGRAFETGYMPKYMHDILVMALHSNSFVLVNESTNDEVQYSPVSDYDQNKPDRFILSTANIDLVLTDQLNRLSLCALGACQAPESIFASAITTTTLTVNWDDITGVTGWEVRYRNYATGGTWTVVTTATNSKGLTGLTSGITYEIQVRTECDTDVFSMWTISYLVRTD
jgi:hypothetical protein